MKIFNVTMVLVADVRTAGLELLRPALRNSMRSRTAIPAVPKSRRAWSTQAMASACALGAFCLVMGS